MRIGPSIFANGGEVDYWAGFEHRGRVGRVSMRRNGRRYEFFIHWFHPWTGLGEDETVLFGSESLEEAVRRANEWMRAQPTWQDRVDDEYAED